jgi:hypothetical protein
VARSTFGGRPGDFTIVDPSTTSNIVTVAPSVTGATVWSAKTGGTQYTDLLVGGTPATTVSSDSKGALVPFQGPDGINVAVWVQFGATRVLIDPQDFNVTALVTTALTAQKGIANGVAALDATATVPIAQLPDPVPSMAGKWVANGNNFGVGMPQMTRWQLLGSTDPSLPAGEAPSLAVGYLSADTRIQHPGLITRGPRIVLNDYSTTNATSIDIQMDTGTGFVSIFGAGPYPTVPTNATELLPSASVVPTTTSVPLDAALRVVPVSVAPQGGASATPAAFIGTANSFTTGSGSLATHAIPLPAGATNGETILLFFTTQSGTVTHTPPSADWRLLGTVTVVDGASAPQNKMTVWAATMVTGLSGTFTTAGTASVGYTRRLTGTGPTLLDMFGYTEYQTGATLNFPANTAANAYDVMVQGIASYQPAAMTGAWVAAYTAGMTTTTEELDTRTTRATANTALEVVTRASGYASAASIPSGSVALSGGTGSAGNTSWASAIIGVRRAPGTHGPSRAMIELAVQSA